ncbi:MAG: NAD(P)-binding protein, partial [Candidatus Altimarinota bacterium]
MPWLKGRDFSKMMIFTIILRVNSNMCIGVTKCLNNSKKLSNSKIIGVIGGGAAGMMAAYFAKLNNPEAEVLLFEKNKYIGAKVIISG